jgi:hypothetical protein
MKKRKQTSKRTQDPRKDMVVVSSLHFPIASYIPNLELKNLTNKWQGVQKKITST